LCAYIHPIRLLQGSAASRYLALCPPGLGGPHRSISTSISVHQYGHRSRKSVRCGAALAEAALAYRDERRD
jgi:hypothetical protein